MTLISKDSSMCANSTEAFPMAKITSFSNDQAYITMLGFDTMSFDRIFVNFCPMYSGHTTPFEPSGMIVEFKYTSGRKREVQPEDCLGLVLMWTCTRG